MVWEKAWLEESHAALGGASSEAALTCHAVLMAQQATQRHFPRIHVLSEELWERALPCDALYHRLLLAAWGKFTSPWL